MASGIQSERIRLSGIVQGVGMRPTVWHLAHRCGLTGDVCNDGDGVLIKAHGQAAALDDFCAALLSECPPLVRIDSIERESTQCSIPDYFSIVGTKQGTANTGISPDAASCSACIREVSDSRNRRYRYAFTNCTHCGPRLSIIKRIPYDRAQTSMSGFSLCPLCAGEYDNPANRRFHAQPNACPTCGPQLWLATADGEKLNAPEPMSEAVVRLKQGQIVAIKGLGGFHLAVDAADRQAVHRLRQRKHRWHKPFAMMARDIAMIERYCHVNSMEKEQLQSQAAPIVILDQKQPQYHLTNEISTGQNTLGFMLPYTPLHFLLLQELDAPIVLTSGNCSDEPQCTQNQDSLNRLGAIADVFLLHDREIINRIDDSVSRVVAGKPRLIRRARGYAPAPIRLPEGFIKAPELLAMGSELKNTFCLLKNGQAFVSQHIGDLENYATYDDYQRNLNLYQNLYQHHPQAIVIDKHPGYLSSQYGRELAEHQHLPIIEIQHHHAHIAACLADNNYPLTGNSVLGLALDGLGLGDDDALWGGEFLLADYSRSQRLAHFMPVAMPGGTQAVLEPWRSLYASLADHWNSFSTDYKQLDVMNYLRQKPLNTLDGMMEKQINSPRASSCGRLFDAVAAAVGVCRDNVSYEGQAAIELEALITGVDFQRAQGYPFQIVEQTTPMLDFTPMWPALFSDLAAMKAIGFIAARFHKGLANALATMVHKLAGQRPIETLALSGGVFQNRTLLEYFVKLVEADFNILIPRQFPSNDGGLALGQAVIAAANWKQETNPCV